MKEEVILINYTGRKGGGTVVSYEMAKALLDNGCKIVAILAEDIENLHLWQKLPLTELILLNTYDSMVSFIANTIKFNIKGKRNLQKKMSKYNVKAVYCPMVAFWTPFINKLFKKSIKIVVNHDPISHSGEKKIIRILFDKSYESSDVVVVHSKCFLPVLESKYKIVKYLPMGRHDTYKEVTSKEKIVDYDKEKTNFFFFGRIEEYKGIDILGKAYRKLQDKYDNVSLTVIGNGDFAKYKEDYKDLKNLKIINRWIKDEEVESIFKGENLICVCPYKDATQSGVILLSYGYGVPVIATRTGGMEEQVIDRKTGYLVEVEDVDGLFRAMELCVNNNDNFKEMKQNISEYLQSISWESSAKRLIEIINEEISKKSGLEK